MKNKVFTIFATILIMGATVFTSLDTKAASGEWHYSNGGWWYENPDGTYAQNEYVDGYWLNSAGWYDSAWNGAWDYNSTGWWFESGNWYPTNQWLKINGEWYYFKDNGYMACNEWVGNYYLKASGAMAVNEWVGEYYVGNDGAWVPNKTKETKSPTVEQKTTEQKTTEQKTTEQKTTEQKTTEQKTTEQKTTEQTTTEVNTTDTSTSLSIDCDGVKVTITWTETSTTVTPSGYTYMDNDNMVKKVDSNGNITYYPVSAIERETYSKYVYNPTNKICYTYATDGMVTKIHQIWYNSATKKVEYCNLWENNVPKENGVTYSWSSVASVKYIEETIMGGTYDGVDAIDAYGNTFTPEIESQFPTVEHWGS
ncbi:MAG: hypothetical protein VZS44_08075 [Bacilli bacterium]|nr:hypothetical protein [Bacilli bacterium]